MASALDAANHIIQWCQKHDRTISNLKLQIFLYFVQAYFLVESEGKEACFDERIEARCYGPVVPVVYDAYRKYGSLNIDRYGEDVLPKSVADRIDKVLEYFKDYSLLYLCELVHSQTPWKNAFHPFCNQEITRKSLLDFFK